MSNYTVIYERDEAGWWVASVKGVAGCHTQGRSLEQARSRIREALEVAVEDLSEASLTEQLKLPGKAKQVLARRESAQKKLAEDQARAQELTRKAVKTLVEDLEMSVRDAGAVLGLSYQRVQQLIQR